MLPLQRLGSNLGGENAPSRFNEEGVFTLGSGSSSCLKMTLLRRAVRSGCDNKRWRLDPERLPCGNVGKSLTIRGNIIPPARQEEILG